MGNELLATYYINFKKYNIFGCWDNYTPKYEYDFFDVFNEKGICINEGCPFYDFPTRKEIKEFLNENEII